MSIFFATRPHNMCFRWQLYTTRPVRQSRAISGHVSRDKCERRRKLFNLSSAYSNRFVNPSLDCACGLMDCVHDMLCVSSTSCMAVAPMGRRCRVGCQLFSYYQTCVWLKRDTQSDWRTKYKEHCTQTGIECQRILTHKRLKVFRSERETDTGREVIDL